MHKRGAPDAGAPSIILIEIFGYNINILCYSFAPDIAMYSNPVIKITIDASRRISFWIFEPQISVQTAMINSA